MATSNKIQVSNLLVRVQSTEKQADGSLSLSVTYLVNQESQRAKISIPAGKGMSRHVAYRAAVDLYHGKIAKGSEFNASGVVTNSIYKITKGGKEQSGLSTRMVVDQFEMEEPEEIDDELEAIPVRVYEEEEPAKDQTAKKVVAALRKKRTASGLGKAVESSSRAAPLTLAEPSAAISPLTPKPQESNALEDITNTGASSKKKGPGRPRKRKAAMKAAEEHQHSDDDQENGPASKESVEQLSD
ncbi:hypothetical protein BGZ72_000746 [Mortierella alpina]|nr:hypothetical protein BGZ72_000746 [Mortierella alpina]